VVAATGLGCARSIHPKSFGSFPKPFPTGSLLWIESFSKSFTPQALFAGGPPSPKSGTGTSAPPCAGGEAEIPPPEPTTTGSADSLITSLLMTITSLHVAEHVPYFLLVELM